MSLKIFARKPQIEAFSVEADTKTDSFNSMLDFVLCCSVGGKQDYQKKAYESITARHMEPRSYPFVTEPDGSVSRQPSCMFVHEIPAELKRATGRARSDAISDLTRIINHIH